MQTEDGFKSDRSQYIVETDAIYGGGVQLKRGDITTAAQLGQYLDALLAAGAIRPVNHDRGSAVGEHASLH
jgi:hypothetical protein